MDMTTRSFIVCEEQDLVDVADAIRSKSGVSDPLTLGGMIEAVESIEIPGPEWIGDGNTHIWISLPEGRTSPVLGLGVNGTVTVDWGDGSEPDTLTGASSAILSYTPNHHYAKAGDYVITVSGDGKIVFQGSSNGSKQVLAADTTSPDRGKVYISAIKKIEIGSHSTGLANYAFSYAYSLTSLMIPDGITTIGPYAVRNASALVNLVLPNTVQSISNRAFTGCSSLGSVVIPESVTIIGDGAFEACVSLVNVKISGSVTSIYSCAFSNCYAAACFDFSNQTSVPTLAATDAFRNVPTDCIFKIPTALYDEWVAATNWSAIAATNTFVGV